MTKPPAAKIRDAAKSAACDLVIERAAVMMAGEVGASVEMILDRMLTYAAAQAATIDGSPRTATVFRELADKIEGGLFHSITGENNPNAGRH